MKKLTCLLLLPLLIISTSAKKHADLPVKYPDEFTFKFSASETQFIINSLQTSKSQAVDVKTVVDNIMKQIDAQAIPDSTETKKATKH